MPKGKLRWFLTEGLTWQLVASIFIPVIICLQVLNKFHLSSVEAGSFKLTLKENARSLDVTESNFRSFANLDENDLKYFLILCGADASHYIFTDNSIAHDVWLERFHKLEAAGFLIVKDTLVYDTIKKQSFKGPMLFQTPSGMNLHAALVKAIYTQIQAPTVTKRDD